MILNSTTSQRDGQSIDVIAPVIPEAELCEPHASVIAESQSGAGANVPKQVVQASIAGGERTVGQETGCRLEQRSAGLTLFEVVSGLWYKAQHQSSNAVVETSPKSERAELERYEAVISGWLISGSAETPQEVFQALAAICDQGLFKERYSCFEHYCVERFGLNPSDVFKAMESNQWSRYSHVLLTPRVREAMVEYYRLSPAERDQREENAGFFPSEDVDREDWNCHFRVRGINASTWAADRRYRAWELDPERFRNNSEFIDKGWCGGSVFVVPLVLMRKHRMSWERALAVARQARRICIERWPEADVRIVRPEDEGAIDEDCAYSLIDTDYDSFPGECADVDYSDGSVKANVVTKILRAALRAAGERLK